MRKRLHCRFPRTFIRSLRLFVGILVLIAAVPFQGGCLDYFGRADEYPEDILFKPDGTVVFSTTHGNLLASSDQGLTWERLASLEQLAPGAGASIGDLAIAPNGTIWVVYSARPERNYVSFSVRRFVAISCDDGETFKTIRPDGIDFDYGAALIERNGAFPLILTSVGQLYETTTDQGCPDTLAPLGIPNPVGSSGSVADCGDAIYQGVDSRVFRSTDRGQSWELDWDFYKGGAMLVCEAGEIWAYGAWWNDGTRDDRVAKRNSDTGEWVALGRFGLQSQNRILLRGGLLFGVGTDESDELKILAMSVNGGIQEFPNPQLNSDEYLEDFEIAPDGVFWIGTPNGVYRNDVTETWANVWP